MHSFPRWSMGTRKSVAVCYLLVFEPRIDTDYQGFHGFFCLVSTVRITADLKSGGNENLILHEHKHQTKNNRLFFRHKTFDIGSGLGVCGFRIFSRRVG